MLKNWCFLAILNPLSSITQSNVVFVILNIVVLIINFQAIALLTLLKDSPPWWLDTPASWGFQRHRSYEQLCGGLNQHSLSWVSGSSSSLKNSSVSEFPAPDSDPFSAKPVTLWQQHQTFNNSNINMFFNLSWFCFIT